MQKVTSRTKALNWVWASPRRTDADILRYLHYIASVGSAWTWGKRGGGHDAGAPCSFLAAGQPVGDAASHASW